MAKELGEEKVSEIFVGTQIIFHVTDEDHEIDEEVIADALKKHKVKAKGDLERDDEFIL